MYYEHFGLTEEPFLLAPNPKYTFLSQQHHEVMARLVYDVKDRGGLVQLTGVSGTGKTTLCGHLVTMQPEELKVVHLFSPRWLLTDLCDALNISLPTESVGAKLLLDRLESHLLQELSAGRQTLLLIDDAQDLGFDALEQLLLLANLETASRKLLGIILVGQPELHSLLKQPELNQLAQRITARYQLTPLNESDTQDYVRHRLGIAGSKQHPFTRDALHRLHKLTQGVPRSINLLCGRALLMAHDKDLYVIDHRLLHQVAKALSGRDIPIPEHKRWAWGLVGLLAIGLTFPIWWTLDPKQPAEQSRPSEANSDVTPTSHTTAIGEAKEIVKRVTAKGSKSTGIPVTESDSKLFHSKSIGTTPVTETSSPPDASPSPSQAKVDSQASSLIGTQAITRGESSETAENSPQPVISMNDAPAPTTPTPKPVARTIEHTLGLLGQHDDIANAFTTLFSYWQTDYSVEAEGSACEKAPRVGLQCLFGRGDWNNLHFYNRPAVIELLPDNGKRYHAVVSALDAEQVTLDFGNRKVQISKDELTAYWSGSYILLWRPPTSSSEPLKTHSRGPAVLWLRQILERWDGQPGERLDTSAQAHFDWQLTERVLGFQRAAGLDADGIVGRNTLIKLNTLANSPQVPVLDKQFQQTVQRAKLPVSSSSKTGQSDRTQLPKEQNTAVSPSEITTEPTRTVATHETSESRPQPAPPAPITDADAHAIPPAPSESEILSALVNDALKDPMDSSTPSPPIGELADGSATPASGTGGPHVRDQLEDSASEPLLAKAAPALSRPGEENPETSIPRVKDLPKTVQKLFADLEIIIHFYHEIPTARFVMIGKQRYREGDALERPGFKLVRITPKWVIVDYGAGLVRL